MLTHSSLNQIYLKLFSQKEDSELMTELWLSMEQEQNELQASPYVDIPGYTIDLEFVERYVWCSMIEFDHL